MPDHRHATEGRPPTIAHVVHSLGIGGAETLAAGLARQLHGSYRFVFLCLDDAGPLAEALRARGIAVEILKRRPGLDLPVAHRLAGAVHRHRVDLLHTHQYTPFFYAAVSRALRPGPTLIFTEHGRHQPDHRTIRRVATNRLLLRRSDRITAVGRAVRDALVRHEGLAARRVQVIPNGIDPGTFGSAAARQARSAVRRELGLTGAHPVAVQVARFHPVTDHATAIRAMKQVVQRIPRAVLVVVGDGPQRAALETMVAGAGLGPHVRVLGLRRDVLCRPDARKRMGDEGRQGLIAHFTQKQMHERVSRLYDQMLNQRA
jgi:glycosyltransferase involved in cell wall biosynthesis